jgi:hypothetical protein
VNTAKSGVRISTTEEALTRIGRRRAVLFGMRTTTIRAKGSRCASKCRMINVPDELLEFELESDGEFELGLCERDSSGNRIVPSLGAAEAVARQSMNVPVNRPCSTTTRRRKTARADWDGWEEAEATGGNEEADDEDDDGFEDKGNDTSLRAAAAESAEVQGGTGPMR